MKEFNRDEYISECYSEPAHSVRRPHKHAELIKAWADGAEIQMYYQNEWVDVTFSCWDSKEYRIKPEPKPDKVCFTRTICNLIDMPTMARRIDSNLKLTFDGETGELKSAEVLK